LSGNLPRGRPFRKGVSGNPGGRSKALRAVETAAKAHTDAAIETLAEICADRTAPPSARVSAAAALLDRGWGKPTQPIAGDENRPPIVPVLNVMIAAPDKGTREQWLARRDRDTIGPSLHAEGG
jgi:hypothetical protein